VVDALVYLRCACTFMLACHCAAIIYRVYAMNVSIDLGIGQDLLVRVLVPGLHVYSVSLEKIQGTVLVQVKVQIILES
jgi:hypothetical protein